MKKNCTYRASANSQSVDFVITNFLFQYRNTPYITSTESFAKLLLEKDLRSKFDRLLPSTVDIVSKILKKQVALWEKEMLCFQ